MGGVHRKDFLVDVAKRLHGHRALSRYTNTSLNSMAERYSVNVSILAKS